MFPTSSSFFIRQLTTMGIPVKSHNYRISVLISCATIHPEFGKFWDKSKEICYRRCAAERRTARVKSCILWAEILWSGDTGQVANITSHKTKGFKLRNNCKSWHNFGIIALNLTQDKEWLIHCSVLTNYFELFEYSEFNYFSKTEYIWYSVYFDYSWERWFIELFSELRM